ncbi:MAG: hypothetical protein ACREAU_00760 [Nitrosopumilaceae archaeon]
MNFPLMQDLQKPVKPTKSGIKYQEYTVQLEENEFQGIGIPLRECSAFEETMSDMSNITRESLRDLLREYRGIMINENQ